jgi:hypothetical protein
MVKWLASFLLLLPTLVFLGLALGCLNVAMALARMRAPVFLAELFGVPGREFGNVGHALTVVVERLRGEG